MTLFNPLIHFFPLVHGHCVFYTELVLILFDFTEISMRRSNPWFDNPENIEQRGRKISIVENSDLWKSFLSERCQTDVSKRGREYI